MLPNVGKVAALIGDPVRSKILFALLDGGELSASELAFRGEASPQAASAHLAKLVDGGLLCARNAGRQRLFCIASGEIAHAIEVLASIAPVAPVKSLNQHSAMQRLRRARSCYDHLAGRLGVAVTDALTERRIIAADSETFTVTRNGERFFSEIGVDLEAARASRRHFARACMDWTERRHHVAGSLGAALLGTFIKHEWVLCNPRDRSLEITRKGNENLENAFGIRIQ